MQLGSAGQIPAAALIIKLEAQMILGKTVLWISILTFTTYGLVGFFFPQIPADFGSLGLLNGDGIAEIAATYGGLQIGIGLFCLLAALNADFYRSGLALLAIAIGFLGLARFYTFIVIPDPVTGYTYGAIIYELAIAAAAVIALKK